MTARLGALRLRAHPLLPVLWVFCWLTGGGDRLLPLLLALAWHEGGHLTAALALKLPVEEIEITPLGGVMTVRGLESAPPLRVFALAAAGPAASLIGVFAAPLLYRSGIWDFGLTGAWIHGNLALLLINLLPALPLDGGRMLKALLKKWLPEAAVTKALLAASFGVGLGLCGISLFFAVRGQLLLGPAFAGLYLFYAAAVEGKYSAARYVTALIARRQRLDRETVLPVEMVAAGEKATVRSLLRQLSPGKYHVIQVLAPDGITRLGVIEEKAFCEAVMHGHGLTLSEVLRDTGKSEKEKRLPG